MTPTTPNHPFGNIFNRFNGKMRPLMRSFFSDFGLQLLGAVVTRSSWRMGISVQLVTRSRKFRWESTLIGRVLERSPETPITDEVEAMILRRNALKRLTIRLINRF